MHGQQNVKIFLQNVVYQVWVSWKSAQRRSHFTEKCKWISARISHTSRTIFLKFGIEYRLVLTPSDYELHVIRYSDSYILLRCLSAVLSLLPHLLSDRREIRYKRGCMCCC